jgi:hypothetical protein
MPGWLIACVAALALVSAGCGKRGAPLPPLVRVPAPPADFTAERRGSDVRIRFTVPVANTDGTKPPNIERVEVYRFTGPPATTDAQLLKLGTRVASVPVKAPRNPDVTTEPDEPPEEPELIDEGLDPGATTEFEDQLDASASTPITAARSNRKNTASRRNDPDLGRPLTGPAPVVPSTTYAAVGVNLRGRHGPLTRRVAVPLVPPPPRPSSPKIEYDENAVHVTWTRSAAGVGADVLDLLPSRPLGVPAATVAYHVYDVSPSAAAAKPGAGFPAGQLRLTTAPVGELRFDDARMAWGNTRCYTIRTVETLGALTLESDAPPPTCTTLTDTFPPAAPRDLKAVATQQAITLIWEPNNEKDLQGYIVLRAAAGSDTFERLTPEPIQASSYDDKAPSGAHFVYVVQAVDKAGNISPRSNRADDTAR